MTPDGNHFLFRSMATNLVPGATTARWRLYVYERATGSVQLVQGAYGDPCTTPAGSSANRHMSDDARFVLFTSEAPCVAGDTNASFDAFVIDRTTDVIERVSVDASGGQLAGGGYDASMSADGRYVSFQSHTTSIAPSVPSVFGSGSYRMFRRDRTAGTSEVVSYVADGVEKAFYSTQMDASGQRFVGLRDLYPSTCTWAYLVDMGADTTEEIRGGCSTYGGGGSHLDLSADGRYVSFADSSNYVGILDTQTDERYPCAAPGIQMTDNGRWMLGSEWMGVQPDVVYQLVRTRCW